MSRQPTPFIQPLLLSEQEKPPAGDDWVHEIKFDGYRVVAHVAGSTATVYTRRGNDWTRQFRPLADAVAKLPVKRAIIDGEAVVLSEAGLADFHALRGSLDGRSTRLQLYAFDLLMLDGKDLCELPLLERKARLQKLLAGAPPALVYVEHITGDGARILEHACRMGIEGIESKRAASPYRSGPVDGLDQDEMRAQRYVRGRRVRRREGWSRPQPASGLAEGSGAGLCRVRRDRH